MLPTKIPSMKIVCDKFDKYSLLHTKSHCFWIVLVKISVLNTCCGQFGSHLLIVSFEHVKSGFGAKKIIPKIENGKRRDYL